MGEPKPLASLSSSLLARKGQARPAMRPQGFASYGNPMGASHADLAQDDLGWNDMGHDAPIPIDIHADSHRNALPLPPVARQQEALAEQFAEVPQDIVLPHPVTAFESDAPVEGDAAEEIHPAPASRPIPNIAVARVKKAAKGRTGKAAFTLRLDPDRHLRLRLACAVGRISAQAIVTEALDRHLGAMPEIDALARKVPGGA